MVQLFMFPPALRASREQIEEVMRYGQKKVGDFGYIRFKTAATPAGGVIVPKKVDKRSSVRVQIKRRVRAIMTPLLQEPPSPLIAVYYCTKVGTFAEYQQELTSLWPK